MADEVSPFLILIHIYLGVIIFISMINILAWLLYVIADRKRLRLEKGLSISEQN